MFLFVSLVVCALLLRGDAQDRAALWRGNDRSGRCQYTFTVASPSEASCPQSSGPELEGLKARLSMLEVLVSRLTAGGDTAAAAAAAAGAPPPKAPAAPSELQAALDQAVGERDLLRGEKRRLEQELERLQRRTEEMRRETERLKSRPCPPLAPALPPSPSLRVGGGGGGAGLAAGGSGSSPMSHLMGRSNRQGDSSTDSAWHGSPGFHELKAKVTEVPVPESPQENAGCGELVSIGDPVTHRRADSIEGKYGVWMQDPEPVSPYGPNTIWRIDTIGADVRKLFGYDDMEQLSKGFPSKVLLLPEQVESTGAAVFRGSLYYQRRLSRTLIRYDLASESVAARRELPHAGYHGQFPYSWGGYTDIDLSVDEQGLWVVYSTSKARGAIVISKLDPHNLEVKRSWETSIRKASVANSFVLCGRLYTVASYTAPDTVVNYVYDTETSQGKAVSIPFRNKHRYNSMIDYNLAQRKLFAWDNYHMVSYDIRLGHKQGN